MGWLIEGSADSIRNHDRDAILLRSIGMEGGLSLADPRAAGVGPAPAVRKGEVVFPFRRLPGGFR